MLRYMTDRDRPGLVALYDIRPGNGAGQFLQPWSPHGASFPQRSILYESFITSESRSNQIILMSQVFLEQSVDHYVKRWSF